MVVHVVVSPGPAHIACPPIDSLCHSKLGPQPSHYLFYMLISRLSLSLASSPPRCLNLIHIQRVPYRMGCGQGLGWHTGHCLLRSTQRNLYHTFTTRNRRAARAARAVGLRTHLARRLGAYSYQQTHCMSSGRATVIRFCPTFAAPYLLAVSIGLPMLLTRPLPEQTACSGPHSTNGSPTHSPAPR